ncbi:RNA polymerase sigma factor [Streptomyces paludis]|uniref:RNA polymerase sigma factor n=1 Tax=Streptomyces paludis TaxID=2282738 RepID=A0A345I1B2_9ACTN|nr:RNA polymerase sigma factor [Streptomyces paludis]
MRERDRSAFEALFRRYAPWLAARLRYRCADPGQLDDIVQESFLAVWRRCAEGQQPEIQDFGGWLWRIASRRLVDAARTHGAQSRLQRALSALRGGTAPSAEQLAMESGRFGALDTALGRLTPELRDVVQATVLDGLTTRQTAQRLRLPTGTVKTRAMRARKRLREELARAEYDEAPEDAPAHTGDGQRKEREQR